MNRIILLVLFVFSYCVGSSQAISQRGTTAVTVQDARLFAQYNFRPPVFSDTTQANLQIGLDSCGALIFSRDINAYYYRACNPKRWVVVSSGAITSKPWDIGGNASPSSPNIGTTTASEFNFITNGIARAKILASGINRSAAARNKYLMIDTTSRYLYYGDAGTTIDTTNQFVNRITRTPGKDSIIYFVGANRFAIKDSVGGSSIIPNLQQVTDIGNVTINNIKAESYYLWDSAVDAYARLKYYGNSWYFIDVDSVNRAVIGEGGIALKNKVSGYEFSIIGNNLTANKQFQMPNYPTGANQVLPISVNGNYADTSGNITITSTLDTVYTQSPIMSITRNDSNIIYFNADTANAWRGGGTGGVGGSGTQNFVSKWSASTTLTDSQIFDSVNVGIGTASPAYKLDVNGTGGFASSITASSNGHRFGNLEINTSSNASTTGQGIRITGTDKTFQFQGSGKEGSGDMFKFGSYISDTSKMNLTNSNTGVIRVNSGFTNPNTINLSGNVLWLTPSYDFTENIQSGITVRGVYYNPNVDSLSNVQHIAFENSTGDIIHKNIATGSGNADKMVTVDSLGKLKTQTIPSGGGGTVTSVGLTMPSAFTVSSSPVTTSGTIAVTGAGTVSQYVRGNGTLADFPTSTGGGASVSYYLNGSVSKGTIGGNAYKQLNSVPVIGTGTDFTINADGYIAQFITDSANPNKLSIPAGNWNFETYFSASSSGGSPSFYIELYKYDGTTFTLIASNSATPENIIGGTNIDLYFTALAVPSTTLLATDRLAVRFFVTNSGRTITMHTEDSHLSQIITTFSTGLTALNGLTAQVQSFGTGTSGTDFAISSTSATHTFNLPTASATNRGALSTTDWSTFNGKLGVSDTVSLSNRINTKQTNLDLLQSLSYGIKAEPYGCSFANATSTIPMTSTGMYFYPFNWNVSDTIRGVAFFNRILALAVTASNYNGIAIYSLSGSTLTRQVSTTNSGTFWDGSANTWKSQSFTPTFLAKGTYYIGYQASATSGLPTIASGTAMQTGLLEPPVAVNSNSIKLSFLIANNTTSAPTSVAMGSTTTSQRVPYFILY